MSLPSCSMTSRSLCQDGVSTTPGATALTRMPSGESSTARARVSALRPPLLATYGRCLGTGRCS
jgi:hypothetical protein